MGVSVVCTRYATVTSVATGVTLALALIVPTLLLTESPCNDVAALQAGDQAACTAPGWAGRASVVVAPAVNTSVHLFDSTPAISAQKEHVVRPTISTTVEAGAFAFVVHWLLSGSTLAANVTASAAADVHLLDEANFNKLKQHQSFTSVQSRHGTDTALEHHFATNATSVAGLLQRFYVVAANPGNASSAISANVSTQAELAQFDLAAANQTCRNKESCSFSNAKAGQVLLVVAHSSFADGAASVAMGWGYKFTLALPGVVVVLALFAAVAVVAVIAAIATFRQAAAQKAQQQQQHSYEDETPESRSSSELTR